MQEFYLVNKLEILNPFFQITIEPTKPMELLNLGLITLKINNYDLILHCEKSADEALYSKCPIVYSREAFLEDFKFLENTNYTIQIKHDNLENLNLQPRLHTFSSNPLTTSVQYLEGFAYTRVNWNSYVGKDSINVFWNLDDSFSLPIEVRTAKINYFSDFNTMVNNINSVCSKVLWSNKSTTSLNAQNTLYAENNLISKFFFIRSAFSEEKLPSSFQEILNAPITKLEEHKKELTIGEVSSFNYKTITSMINSPYWVTSDPSVTYLSNSQNTLPYILNEYNTQLSYDTTENRFIKYLLNEIYSILSELVVLYTKQTFVGLESFRLLSIVDNMLSNNFLHAVNNTPYVETGNLALRRVSGYSDFFNFYEQLMMSETLQWEELYNLLFHKQIKPVYDLYEAWVLTEFMEILRDMSTGDFSVEFGSGKKFIKKITSQFYSFKLEVLYQHRINHSKRKKLLTSYSMRMDPDFLLNIYKEDKLLGSVVFDAKYKLNKTNDIFNFSDESLDDITSGSTTEERIAKRVDLMTMHAYKDSIRGVNGSYVILPSIEHSIEFWNENKDIVPSIGAIPLYPSNNNDLKDLQRGTLIHFIKKLITHFKRKDT
ncbi:DUF2357 domain-containing protein [Bacillus cereus]|uniref:DUF2357 domain-containing protein n=1 Tax=Bacillus cereus TaxID=1396 RepID=UPI000B4B056F|nr:DUF2357 domain-containing protein [Bacillus cereus]